MTTDCIRTTSRSNLDIPLSGSKNVSNFSSHNLIESDAIALEGGNAPTYGVNELDKPFGMIQYGLNPEIPGGEYAYYEKYFAHARSYVVSLGTHRLVMLDTNTTTASRLKSTARSSSSTSSTLRHSASACRRRRKR